MFFRFQLNLRGNTPYDQNGDLSKNMFIDEDMIFREQQREQKVSALAAYRTAQEG